MTQSWCRLFVHSQQSRSAAAEHPAQLLHYRTVGYGGFMTCAVEDQQLPKGCSRPDSSRHSTLHSHSCGLAFGVAAQCANARSRTIASLRTASYMCSDQTAFTTLVFVPFAVCSKCKEVRCKEMWFKDGYGQKLEREFSCFDRDASVVVTITDTCPCTFPGNYYSNRRWCCGDMYHVSQRLL